MYERRSAAKSAPIHTLPSAAMAMPLWSPVMRVHSGYVEAGQKFQAACACSSIACVLCLNMPTPWLPPKKTSPGMPCGPWL